MSEDLILGKYKDTAELEKAFKSLKKGYDDLKTNSNKFIVPESYSISERTSLIEGKTLDKAQELGKKYGFTQSQYEEYAVNQAQESMERAKRNEERDQERSKAIAEVNDLEDIKKHWQEDFKFSDKTFNKLSVDEIKQVGELRQKSLNSNTKVGGQANILNTNLSRSEIYSKMESSRKSGNMSEFNNMMKLYKQT
jgi:hypothetical protein